MGKVKTLAAAGLIGISGLANAGSLEELKQLLNSKNVNIEIAITGDYLYTADRKDSINNSTGYEDQFGYNAYVGIFKEATQNDPIGFGLSFANTWTPVVGHEPLPSNKVKVNTDESYIEQVDIDEAYIEAKTGMLTITAGRILTNVGGEAPYTWQNVNIQRGLLWNAEPVFYNGIRVSTDINNFSVYAGVNDADTSDGKMALEAGVATSFQNIDAALNVFIPDKSDEENTRVYNLTLNLNYFEKLPLTFYVDYLDQPTDGSHVNGWGAALLGAYKVDNNLSIGGRIEYVNNDGDGDVYSIGKGNSAWTLTVTPKYQLNKYLYIRGEASYVKLANDAYQKSDKDNDMTDNELRLGVELGFVF